MRKLYIVGASIGFSVGLAMARLPGIGTEYKIINLCKKGAKYSQFNWPAYSEVEESDRILIFPFGNDMQTGRWTREKTGDRTFHLLDFVPQKESVLREYYADLTVRILRYKCKFTIVTSFYRFLCPCHKHKNLVRHFRLANKNVISEFKGLDNVTVLDHRSLVSEKVYKAKRDLEFYISLLKDQVHFRDNNVIARRIFATFE